MSTNALVRMKTERGYLSNLSSMISNNYDLENCEFIEAPHHSEYDSTKLLILNGTNLEIVTVECLERTAQMMYPINVMIKTLPIKDIVSIEEKYDFPSLQGNLDPYLESAFIKFKNPVDDIHINLTNNTPYFSRIEYTHADDLVINAASFIKKLKSLI